MLIRCFNHSYLVNFLRARAILKLKALLSKFLMNRRRLSISVDVFDTLAPFNVFLSKVSKNLPSWNLGGRQIVSGPIFSDSPYKNRLVANFSALEDLFWPKFSTFSTRGVRTGQNWRKNLFVPQVPNFIRFAWNSFLRSKTMSAMRFRLNFD